MCVEVSVRLQKSQLPKKKTWSQVEPHGLLGLRKGAYPRRCTLGRG